MAGFPNERECSGADWLDPLLLKLTKHLAESTGFLNKRGKASAPPEDLAVLNWTKVSCYPRGREPAVFKSSVPPVTLWPIKRESCNIRQGPRKPLRGKLISVLFNSHALYRKYQRFSRSSSSWGCSANTAFTNSFIRSLKEPLNNFFLPQKLAFGKYVHVISVVLKVWLVTCSQITKFTINIHSLKLQINKC